MKTSRTAAALLTALALVATSPSALGSPPGAAAHAKLAPTLTITAGDPDRPVEVPLPTEDPSSAALGYRVEVAGGPATNVTVSVSGTGLTTSAPQNLGTVGTSAFGSAAITANTGGFHQLTFTVTADGAAPAATTLNRVWAPTGGLTVSPVASLRDTYYGTTGTYSEAGTSYDDTAMLLFLTDDTAYYGAPHAGLPKCRTASTTAKMGCLAYAYDPASQLIQVGGAIGRVDTYGVHTVGLGITDYQGGEYYPHRDWLDRWQLAHPHRRYAGTWRWAKETFLYSDAVSLTLRKDGTFVLSDGVGKKKRTIKGRYAVSGVGRMVLRGGFGKQIRTFAVRLDKKGKRDLRQVALTFGTKRSSGVVFLTRKRT